MTILCLFVGVMLGLVVAPALICSADARSPEGDRQALFGVLLGVVGLILINVA